MSVAEENGDGIARKKKSDGRERRAPLLFLVSICFVKTLE